MHPSSLAVNEMCDSNDIEVEFASIGFADGGKDQSNASANGCGDEDVRS